MIWVWLLVGAPSVVFTGDVMLSREVAREMTLRPAVSPWQFVDLSYADAIIGNLEGAVGSGCAADPLCFAIAPEQLEVLRRGHFTTMTTENNHAGDLGDTGREATREALSHIGISAVDFERSPTFVKVRDRTLAIVALSEIPGRDQHFDSVPSEALRQKLHLARALADYVAVCVHWGAELMDWVQPNQLEQVKWLIANGASIIIGHHPHVVVPPTCVDGVPVFYSLGNHVFDQKYPLTKRGMLATCTVDSTLRCGASMTVTSPQSAYPRHIEAQRPLQGCEVLPHPPVSVAGFTLSPSGNATALKLHGQQNSAAFTTRDRPLLRVEPAPFDGREDLLFTLERYVSGFDSEAAPRPYVYAVTGNGLVARWRGTSLAWPLVDATLLRHQGEPYLCALHRGDSFVRPEPENRERRTQVYRWNGFGFSAENLPALSERCTAVWRDTANWDNRSSVRSTASPNPHHSSRQSAPRAAEVQ